MMYTIPQSYRRRHEGQEHTKRPGTRWSDDEIERLRVLADRGAGSRVIALHLGRTVRSVINKAWEMGIPLRFAR